MGARAAAALRRAHFPSPLLRRPDGDGPGERRARSIYTLQMNTELRKPPRTWLPRCGAPPPFRIPSPQYFVGGVFEGEAYHVSVEAQLAFPDLAVDTPHPRPFEHLLVRHPVLPSVPEDTAEGDGHKGVQPSSMSDSQGPCFTRVKQDRHD